jgi:hypothetical protein
MKALLLSMLTLLFLLGCSSSSSNGPTAPIIEENEAIQAIEHNNDSDSPVTDIEPGEPLCFTENFGWVELANPSGRPVRVEIGTQISVLVPAGSELTVQVGAGWHELTWRPDKQMPYSEPVPVGTCDTTQKTFSPAFAYKATAKQ